MKAKEKAVELVGDFVDAISYRVEMFNPNLIAKECALIAVDFHIAEFIDVYGDDLIDNIEYWKEVKIEIEKL